jgi:hypothetical protein
MLALLPLVIVAPGVVVGVRSQRRYGDIPERAAMEAATAGLSTLDRLRVNQAVTAGRAVNDPRLAPAAVARARFALRYNERYRAGRFFRGLPWLAALLLAGAVVRLATADQGADWVAGAGITAAALGNLAVLLAVRRSTDRLTAAERANAALLPG